MVIFPDLLIEVFKEDERIKYLQEAGDMGNKEQDRHIKGTQLNIFFKKTPNLFAKNFSYISSILWVTLFLHSL